MTEQEGEFWKAKWEEDARDMGRATVAAMWLSRRLAELGINPSQVVALEDEESAETEELADEWFKAGSRAAAHACGQKPTQEAECGANAGRAMQ